MKNSALILWFEGLDPQVLSTAPSSNALALEGVDLTLRPAPLFEKSVCYYQALTGMGSGKTGRFDAVYPERYAAQEDHTMPEGARGKLLTDILAARKLAVTRLEVRGIRQLDSLAGDDYDCAIVRLLDMGKADLASIEAIVRLGIELAGSTHHILVLTDVCEKAPEKLVNINDFLAEVGLLEVGGSREREDIVWSETLAYGLGTGQVWVNLRGREPQGVVGPGREYQEVCAALAEQLLAHWRDPQTYEPVVQRVLKKEEAYSGQYLFKAPDLAVVYRPGYAASPKARGLDLDGVSVRGVEGGAQPASPCARLIASGPSLNKGKKESAGLVDLMPSIMYLLGQPVPAEVDGRVISSIFTPAYRQDTPEKRLQGDEALLSDEEEGLIVDRLRDLGYLG